MSADTEAQTNSASEETKPPPTNQLVTFHVGSEEYGFDILNVREIVRPVRVTRIPLAPRHVEGVANLRGDVLPIIDLRKKFGIQESVTTDKSRILVVDKDDKFTGLIVDAVHQVASVLPEQLDEAPESISSHKGRYLANVAKLDEGKRIVMNLDPRKICEIEIDSTLFDRTTNKDASHNSSNTRKTSEETVMSVIFETDGIEYCLPIENVMEVIRLREPRRPSNMPDYLRGILALRGKVLPVIDMRRIFGRRPIEAQRRTELLKSKMAFESWADSALASNASKSVNKNLIQSGRKAIDQALGFRSANEELNQAFDSLRLTAQNCLKHFQAIQEETDDLEQELLDSLVRQTTAAFDACTQLVATGAKDDQRIVVVRSSEIEIGLLVDHVREVKPLPKSCIEEPPPLSKRNGQELIGVAKIDGGKRIILMLDPGGLLPQADKQQLIDSLKDEAKALNQNTEKSMKHSTLTAEEEIQLVCFNLAGDEFAAPIHSIREIDRISRITAIPDAPEYIEGITNLRGEVLPVVNLRKRFKLPEKTCDDKSRIIVADIEGRKTGLIVDAVSHVLRIPASIISGSPRETQGSPLTEFVTGIAKANNGKRIIVVLDLEKLVNQTDTSSAEG